MNPFARINLSSAALRRGILVSSLAFAAGCNNYREYALHEIKLDQEITGRRVIAKSDCKTMHGVIVYARKQEYKTPCINSYNFYYIDLEDGDIDGNTKILAKEMYYFPVYVPKNHVPGQRVKLRYWSKGERIVELSDVGTPDEYSTDRVHHVTIKQEQPE